MSKKVKTILIVGGICFALILASIIVLALVVNNMGRADVAENSVLVLDVSGTLPDYVPENPVAELIGISKQQSFSNLLMQMRKARYDSRIGAVLLNIKSPQIGLGKADEFRSAVKDVIDSGKPVYAYVEFGMSKDYYIAVAADKIYVPPAGSIYANGFAANAVFYKGSLENLGIGADVLKIGKYKNAPDQYTRKKMSEGQREVISSILDDHFDRFVKAIANGRRKSIEDAKSLIDKAPYNGDEAKELGLTDGALYKDQVYEEIKKQLGYKKDDNLRIVKGNEYEKVKPSSLGLNRGENIAVIYASGTINTGSSQKIPFRGEILGSDTIIGAINEASENNSIRAIVLRIDSPGGSALASDLMWNAIEKAKAKKPIVVSMSDVAASGGYYIACNANKIVAESSSLTGSIGVFMGKPVVKGFYDWIGRTNEYVTRGKNAAIFRETEKWTKDERAKIQIQVNKIYYTDFLPKVAKGRDMDVEKVNSLGQGRVWTGKQAKENGLIDEIGGLEKAIETAKILAKLPSDKDVKRVIYPKPRSFFDTYFGWQVNTLSQVKQKELVKALPESMRRALRHAYMFDQMKKGDAMMLMPFELEIE